jgi:hypothetical protein
MANGAMIITWGAPVTGREMKGLDVFGRALAFWDEKAKEGRIHGHHEYFSLTGNVSERAGTMVIDGDLDELAKLSVEEDNVRILGEAGQIVQNMTVTLCEANSDESIGRYVTLLQEMGLS